MSKNRKQNKKRLVNRMMRKGFFFSALVTLLVATMASVGAVEAADADEGKIAFVSAGNIHIINPDGTNEIRLTEGTNPLWFPDGKKIAYQKLLTYEGSELYVINIDGTDKTKVFEGQHPGFTLSPNGEKILLMKGTMVKPADPPIPPINEWSICTINTDGNNLVKLCSELYNRHSFCFAFSPDGEKIAYHYYNSSTYPTRNSIYIMNSDGINKAELVSLEGYIEHLSWSPDSKKITYSRGSIFIIDSDGTNKIKIAEGENPVWSPDGKKIAYSDGSSLWVMNPDGTEKTIIVESGFYESIFSWSPDSEKIVYGKKYGEDKTIYIVNADGSGLTKLAYGTYPQWSPVSFVKPIPTPTPTQAVTPTLTLTPIPTLMPTEDAFNYQGEYKLDRKKLRPEESKALPYVMKYAKEYKVSPCLIMAVIRQESNFDVSANGGTDVGYMQVTHDAAKDGGYKGTEQGWRQKDGFDPDQNIQYGTKYLKTLNSIFRDGKLLTEDLKATKVPDKTERLKFVLAAYNGGQGRIAKAQQICEDEGDNPERWDDTKKYLEAAGATPEKAKIIKNYVEQVIEGRDFIDGQHRGYEFFLAIRVPVSETPAPEEGVPGFEVIFAIAGLLAVAYLVRRRK